MNLVIQGLAMGWSHGSVLAKSRNSSRVPRRNSARRQSFFNGFQRQVPQRLQHIEQNGQRNSVQHQRLKRVHHLELVDWTERKEQQLGVTRVLQSQPMELIGGEASRGEDVTERTL